MSLFKAREWWETNAGEQETFDHGCLCVGNADNNEEQIDKIIIGSYNGTLRIYKPLPVKNEDTGKWSGFNAQDVLCEKKLSEPILQIELGRFISTKEQLSIGVLHPRKFAVYTLCKRVGTVEYGIQYELSLGYEHNLKRTSFNFCYGPFGAVKNKDLVCIQSLDGTLSVIEQESFAFSRFLPGALLPGPVGYIPTTDSFVTVSSSRFLESYKYQVLAVASDSNDDSKSGKRVASDWSFNIGDYALDMRVLPNANGGYSIIILTERNVINVKDTGKLEWQKKLEITPSSFQPFFASSDSSIRYLVSSTNLNTLLVFEATTLIWAAQIHLIPVDIRIINNGPLKGGVVVLNENGLLKVLYMGTDPEFISSPSLPNARDADYSAMDRELRQLQTIIKNKSSSAGVVLPTKKAEDEINFLLESTRELDVPSLSKLESCEFYDWENPYIEYIKIDDLRLALINHKQAASEITDEVPSMTFQLTIKCKATLNDVTLCLHVPPPFVTPETLLNIPHIESSKPFNFSFPVFVKWNMAVSNVNLTASIRFTTSQSTPHVSTSNLRIPLRVYARSNAPCKTSAFKITLNSNTSTVDLAKLFPDFVSNISTEPLAAIGFQIFGTTDIVTVLGSNNKRYRIQCDTFASIWPIADELIIRLEAYHNRIGQHEFKLVFDSQLPLEEYFMEIDSHFLLRKKDDEYMKALAEKTGQLRAVQRRLLTRFKDKTPSPLNNLDALLESTYKQILLISESSEHNRICLRKAFCEVEACTRLICCLLKLWVHVNGMTDLEFAVLESIFALDPVSEQRWHEQVDTTITFLLRTCLAKSAKDATLNPQPLQILSDTDKLKKHLALLIDRLSKGGKLIMDGINESNFSINNGKNKKVHLQNSNENKKNYKQSNSPSSQIPFRSTSNDEIDDTLMNYEVNN